MRSGNAEVTAKLVHLAGNPHDDAQTGAVDNIDEIIAIVRQTGALDVTRQAAAEEAQRAVAATSHLPANPYTAALLQLAAQLLERRS